MAEQRKVNLNSAGRDDFTEIIGIGEECADRIIRYQEEHGGINDVEELVDEMKGFGERAMQHLRERATV